MQISLRPGIRQGSYPQKTEPDLPELELAVARFFERLKQQFARKKYSRKYITRQVERHQQRLQGCSDEELNEHIQLLRRDLHHQGLLKELILQAFAVIREASARVLGKSHYDVQLYGGWIMLNGMLAEMETGEGKTLTTTLPACTAALAGIPVHVITANDYLAARDCELMLPLYQRLGLSAASVTDGMETDQRRECYAADIVHTTNQQVAFDYLRDRIEMGQDTGSLRFQFRQIQRRRPGGQAPLLLRGLCFALVDEADSVLIDEARTPLIITRPVPDAEPADTYSDALYLASTLFQDQDFILDERNHRIELTADGEERLGDLVLNLPGKWQQKRRREMLVVQALTATYFYKKDKHYVVDDSKVKIIDESTGRLMPDRSWEQGLHQMIEAKEGCVISEMREPLARISYQRFFSRYLRLGGTSGTISEVAAELHQVYGLDVVGIAPYRPNKRIMQGEKVYRNEAARKKAVIERISALHRQQHPVLVGTCSVQESEQVSHWLHEIDVPHRVLNAKQDQQEADIIANAGLQGAITVATNMAGRGTDIGLSDGVKKMGGLHVLALSRNASGRIDRQLYGRCARQGDPGSAEAMVSLQDPSLEQFYSSAMLRLLAGLAPGNRPLPGWISRLVLRLPQQRNEKEQRMTRKLLMKQDQRLRRILAFSGKFE